jgi:hypothetical protein
MDSEKWFGLTEITTRENSSKVSDKAKESESIWTVVSTRENMNKTNRKETEYIDGKTVRAMRASGTMEFSAGKVLNTCQTGPCLTECGTMVYQQELAFASTLMAVATMVTGRKDNLMELAKKLYLTEQLLMVSGSKAEREGTE